MSLEQSKAAARRCFDDIWNKGNLAAIPDVIAADYVGYTLQGATKGLAAFEQSVRNARTAFPNLHYTIDSMVGEGDTLALRLTLTGTMTGKMGNAEPTGKSFDYKMALFNKYSNGKCVESVLVGNRKSINQQLGVPDPTP